VSSPLLQSILSNTWAVFLIVVFFNGTIFVHELGHFLAARRRGVRVERFSIGFGPKIFGWRGKDGVEYRLSWLPLGGYVLLPQLADLRAIEGESEMTAETLPPVGYWTKMLVFVAGATCNMIFAFLLACVVWLVGQPIISDFNTTKIGLVMPTITLPDNREVPSPASQAGLKPGDVVRAIDGIKVADWGELQETLYASAGRADDGRRKAVFTIDRAGQILELPVYPLLVGSERTRFVGIAPAEDLIVGPVKPGLLGEKIGLRPGDQILAYDSVPLLSRDSFVEYLKANRARSIGLTVQRGTARVALEIPPRPALTDFADLGLLWRRNVLVLHPDPLRQLRDDFDPTIRVLMGLFNPHSDVRVSQLSGPVGIFTVFYLTAQNDVRLVLWFTILLNVNLAVVNLLPIPVFDGGQMLFATISRLRKRSLPADFIMTTQSVFVVLIISFFFYVTFFDVRRIRRDAPVNPAPPPAQKAAPAAP